MTSGQDRQHFVDLECFLRDVSGETGSLGGGLDLESARLLAELCSLRTIDPTGGNLRTLTAGEWLERWETFRARDTERWPFVWAEGSAGIDR